MLDQFFITINMWMLDSFTYALIGSFLWGMVSILFSPCHLASIPLMIGYVAGQEKIAQPRSAALYSILFSFGLFVSIAIVGIICSLLGMMLGDISPYWGILIGLLLIFLGLDLTGLNICRIPSAKLGRFRLRGYFGALILGLSYGILSGACTFGFIAPILAIITVQAEFLKGISMIIFFALGHCLPIVIAGSSVALSQKFLENKGMQNISNYGRKLAGLLVVGVGIYFILNPFI